MSVHMRIDIYSDTVCPWCLIGLRRFELALAQRPQYEPQVTWRPFELNPDLPWEGVERAGYLAAKFADPARLAAVQALLVQEGERLGIQFRFDLIERMPNTRRSHLLVAHAARRGCQRVIQESVLSAYFEQGIDIGDTEELVRLGARAGLREREVRSALVLREGQDGVVAAERHASVLKITGVPTYIFNGQYTVSGAQEPASLVQIFDEVSQLAAARAGT
jgi:predicted DsbA family dithiol-disulfide isomerase